MTESLLLAFLTAGRRHRMLRLLTCLALYAVAAQAQAPGPQTVVVDPALLAKATAGDVTAELKLGDLYAAGKGASREPIQLAADYKLAASWYQKAADQGNIQALRDTTQAVAWYRKAANQGDAGAEGTLGLLYSVGMGIPRDDVEAYFWLSLAAAAEGPNQARYMTNRQSVGEHITTDQEAAVKDRIAAWKAAHPRTGPAE
jgi:TPR repeat protein